MNKRRISAVAMVACAVATIVAIPVSASANTIQSATCNEVGVIYGQIEGSATNVTFCGLGFFYEPSNGGWVVTSIHPTTHNRWWFHQNADGSGWSWCTDYTHENSNGYVIIPAQYQIPEAIQVSSNTASC